MPWTGDATGLEPKSRRPICVIVMSKKILVIEDEVKILRTVRLYLEQAGYTVVAAADGAQGLAAFRKERPALVLLDLNLPGELDGLDVCRGLRQTANVPVIMLTARSDETDRLIGLELGADDYIPKPFSPREVVARVRAVLRRADPTDTSPTTLDIAGVSVGLHRRAVAVAGRAVELTPSEYDLLVALMGHPGRVFTRAQLLEMTQETTYEGYERTIDQHVKNLRQKIEPDPREPRYVLTVFGVGYRFVEA